MKTTRHSLPADRKQALVRQIESYLQTELTELLAAYVFGSFAAGDNFADIDVALLFKSGVSETLELELATENKLEQLLRVPVDMRVLNAAPLSFQYQVIRDGRLIIDKDPNRRADYEGQVLKQYFDFSRFRKRYLKEVAHAPL